MYICITQGWNALWTHQSHSQVKLGVGYTSVLHFGWDWLYPSVEANLTCQIVQGTSLLRHFRHNLTCALPIILTSAVSAQADLVSGYIGNISAINLLLPSPAGLCCKYSLWTMLNKSGFCWSAFYFSVLLFFAATGFSNYFFWLDK